MIKLKSWPVFFRAIKAGEKTHDLRSKKDRTFFIGQHLLLEEYDPFNGRYSGERIVVEITYITDDVTPCAFSSAVLDKGYCILSIKVVSGGNSNSLFGPVPDNVLQMNRAAN